MFQVLYTYTHYEKKTEYTGPFCLVPIPLSPLFQNLKKNLRVAHGNVQYKDNLLY